MLFCNLIWFSIGTTWKLHLIPCFRIWLWWWLIGKRYFLSWYRIQFQIGCWKEPQALQKLIDIWCYDFSWEIGLFVLCPSRSFALIWIKKIRLWFPPQRNLIQTSQAWFDPTWRSHFEAWLESKRILFHNW